MELSFEGNKILFNKELNKLDNITIQFTSILNKLNIKYVLVSGYVAILFGRSRSSEDIDLLIEKIDFVKFQRLWQELIKHFECIITESCEDAYKEYLLEGNSIRFSEKGMYVPNVEVKFPDKLNELDLVSLNEKIEVILNGNIMFVSPIELQIAFKFYLGSEKDIEDAYHLYTVFKDILNIKLLEVYSRKLKIEERLRKYIK